MDFTAAVLYVPDAQGVMGLSGDLVYNDAPWIPASENVRLVHPKISCEVASIPFMLCQHVNLWFARCRASVETRAGALISCELGYRAITGLSPSWSLT